MRAMLLDAWYWVGLTDQAAEGTFVWLNGNIQASTELSMWHPQDPEDDGPDCVIIVLIPARDYTFRLRDVPCDHQMLGLCEKRA